ncbi:hypothetical protein ACFW9D_08875 [Streptomyces sp. NPDC059524]|uniref:hypothetical protein n=1 Tax=Streptomyces sp. NPDC059524 TaxID=3346856 RepID=UPI001CB7A2DC|nr:hypothetical protein [Streptomyces xanthii]
MRHDFFPGRLVAGVVLLVTAVVYFGDAGEAWTAPWWVAVPLVCGGLVLALLVGAVTQLFRVRGRRRSSD